MAFGTSALPLGQPREGLLHSAGRPQRASPSLPASARAAPGELSRTLDGGRGNANLRHGPKARR
jgi:hypothetical protein